jgi:2-iminobutanoate/2-iminopropanoate deaminase
MKKRHVIKVPGLEHQNPIPLATRVGSLLVTGAIPGKDPATGRTGTGLETQCALMFNNIRRVMEAAGGSIDDIIKLSIWLAGDDKSSLNEQWIAMFPDRNSQPARHTFQNQSLPQNYLIQCEVMAVIEND